MDLGHGTYEGGLGTLEPESASMQGGALRLVSLAVLSNETVTATIRVNVEINLQSKIFYLCFAFRRNYFA